MDRREFLGAGVALGVAALTPRRVRLRVHALDDGRVRAAARTPLGSYNVLRRAGRVLTPSLNDGTLTVLDASGRTRWQVHVAPAAHDACVVG